MLHAAVEQVRLGRPATQRVQHGEQLRTHPVLQSVLADHALELVPPEERDERLALRITEVTVEAGHIGEDDELARTDRGRDRAGRRVGVHVVQLARGVTAERRDDGDPARIEHGRDGVRVDLDDLTDEADVLALRPTCGLAGQHRTVAADDPLRGRARRFDECDDLGVHDAGQGVVDDLDHGSIGHPKPADEAGHDAAGCCERADLRPSPVHDDRTQSDEVQQRDVGCEGALQLRVDHRVPAVLDDDGLSVEARDPRERLTEDGGLALGDLRAFRRLR